MHVISGNTKSLLQGGPKEKSKSYLYVSSMKQMIWPYKGSNVLRGSKTMINLALKKSGCKGKSVSSILGWACLLSITIHWRNPKNSMNQC